MMPGPPVWRLLPVVLAGAFAIRVVVVLGGDFIYHPDVVFQYLEPAWRLLTGDGLIVWEQFYGARPQLIPAALTLILMALQALGFDHPTTLRTALEIVLCAVSLLVPWGMYAFARIAFDECTGRVALMLGAAWYELVALASQPLSELIALSPLVWAFALAADVRSASCARALGLLLVATCALRFQYGPVAFWLAVLAWPRMAPRLRRQFLVALLAGTAFVGVFDVATVGLPLYRSYLANIAFNAVFAREVAALGADLPWYFHPMALAFLSGGLAVAACTAGLLHHQRDTRVRCALWLLIPITLILITHAPSPWKEYRHVLVVAPLWLTLLATVIGVLWPRRNAGAWVAVSTVGVWFALTSAFGILGKLPLQGTFHREAVRPVPLKFIGAGDPRLSFADGLAGNTGLVGLAETELKVPAGVGFVYLGRKVPIYDQDTIEAFRECGLSPRDYASHAIVPPKTPLPLGFVVTRTGEFGWRLAERTGQVVSPPYPLSVGPVWIGGAFGKLAIDLFEGNLESESWIAKAWNTWDTEASGFFPLGRFRTYGPGPRAAPTSRLAHSPDCGDSVSQQSGSSVR